MPPLTSGRAVVAEVEITVAPHFLLSRIPLLVSANNSWEAVTRAIDDYDTCLRAIYNLFPLVGMKLKIGLRIITGSSFWNLGLFTSLDPGLRLGLENFPRRNRPCKDEFITKLRRNSGQFDEQTEAGYGN